MDADGHMNNVIPGFKPTTRSSTIVTFFIYRNATSIWGIYIMNKGEKRRYEKGFLFCTVLAQQTVQETKLQSKRGS